MKQDKLLELSIPAMLGVIEEHETKIKDYYRTLPHEAKEDIRDAYDSVMIEISITRRKLNQIRAKLIEWRIRYGRT